MFLVGRIGKRLILNCCFDSRYWSRWHYVSAKLEISFLFFLHLLCPILPSILWISVTQRCRKPCDDICIADQIIRCAMLFFFTCSKFRYDCVGVFSTPSLTVWFEIHRKLSKYCKLNLLRNSRTCDGPFKCWFSLALLLNRNDLRNIESSISRTKLCLNDYVQWEGDRCQINNEWITGIWLYKQLCTKSYNSLFSTLIFE